MFQSLLQPYQITDNILQKITNQIITRYEINQINDILQFNKDINQTLQFYKLYNDTLQQTLTLNSYNSKQTFFAYHRQIYKLIQFLVQLVVRKYKKDRDTPKANSISIQNLCSICQSNIYHKTIRNIQQQILQWRTPYTLTQESQDVMVQIGQFDSKLSQDQLIKKMLIIQKNINERQLKLLKCIQDLQSLKNNMSIEIKRQEFIQNFDAFQLKNYVLNVLECFKNRISKISIKIESVKAQCKEVSDQSVQVSTFNEKDQNISKKDNQRVQNLKNETEIRKLNQIRNRLQQSIKYYKVQISELTLKLQVLQSNNQRLEEQIYFQKLKMLKTKTNIPAPQTNYQQKQHTYQVQQTHSIMKNINSNISLGNENNDTEGMAAQFSNQIVQNITKTQKNFDAQDYIPMIKSTFKKKVDSILYKHQQQSNLLQNKKKLRFRQSDMQQKYNSSIIEKPISLQSQQPQKNPNKSQIIAKMKIFSQLNYSLHFKPRKQSINLIKLKSQLENIVQEQSNKPLLQKGEYKKLRLKTQGNVMHKTLSKLKKSDFINSNSKQNVKQFPKSITPNQQVTMSKRQQTRLDDIIKNRDKKVRVEDINKLAAKYRRFKNRTQQSFYDQNEQKGLDNKVYKENNAKQMMMIFKVSNIKDSVVKQFLLINQNIDQFTSTGQQPQIVKYTPNQRQKSSHNFNKNMLNFHQINYVTLFSSLLAKLHLMNQQCYMQVKQSLCNRFSKIGKDLSKLQIKQSLILKKLLTILIIQHRKCDKQKHICIHLANFTTQIQQILK